MLGAARSWLALGVLGLLAGYVLLIPPGHAGTTALELLPKEVAGFESQDLKLEQAVLDDLDPDGILIRRYERAGAPPVWVVVVYFENARLGAHDPELCYRSQGFTVDPKPDLSVPSNLGPVPCRVFDALRGDRDELVHFFWYTAGQRALAEVKTFRDEMFLQGLKRNRSFGAFVRVSTLVGPDRAQAESVLAAFVQELAKELPTMIPEGK
ncbi:MAG: EpsI family protein [Candidatus Eisenbacteria bacterium]